MSHLTSDLTSILHISLSFKLTTKCDLISQEKDKDLLPSAETKNMDMIKIIIIRCKLYSALSLHSVKCQV